MTQAEPGRAEDEAEWHLAGPTLVVFICFLTRRMRLSRARMREFLLDWLGLELSTATTNQCVHEGGRAVAPVVEKQITATIRNIDLLHADETGWKQHGHLLWVFTCAHATLFVVGKRSVEVVREVRGTAFTGWLMSDGFWAYRDLDQRLRCLAHLIRKAHGLE
ncbi:MAG: IS66 family transposase, partial [Sphingobacteriia bacterium]|nr:IS66 family transposase [Sphingobacteriia bacterium]